VRGIEHGGAMDGFSSLLYLLPDRRIGIYIACNRETSGLQDRVKDTFLDRYFPNQEKPDTAQPQPQLRERLEHFAGKYQMDVYCHTCAEGERGYVPAAFEIKANDDGTISFWGGRWRQVEPLLFRLVSGKLGNGEVIVTFREDKNGKIKYMINDTTVNEKLPQLIPHPTLTFNINPQTLNAYVGEYEIAPTRQIKVTLEGNNLMGEMTGQLKVDLFPISEASFTVKGVDAKINFVKDKQGRTTHLILILNGEEMRATKIK
jgi:hypothetical protein